MKSVYLFYTLLLVFTLLLNPSSSLSAQLKIISLSPLYFNLTFSEPTPYPEFQILVNQPAI